MTDPAHGNKSDEKGKEVKKNGIKNNKEVASGEADVEMDSRLLSALLTVSYPTSLISRQNCGLAHGCHEFSGNLATIII